MRLKRLELFGFKSFADRTVLDFERSLTGVVGPNGCGKSNVVDAIRWVLGETRPTSMRGGEMTDVIFKGSTSRPALSVAEVTLVLDNAAGTIEERGAEVAVTRRVYRSGEGEYLIDGERVRLKDVREMLFDTGLGSRGYAVLEQGRIDAVLSANPLDRRAVFEEAAGISRYRQRRKEAEQRLARVQQDLARLEDVVAELERRERSLKIQAGKARRYTEARDAWRALGVRLARHQVRSLDGRLAELGARLEALEDEAEARRRAREAAEADAAAREREAEALAAEVARLADESGRLAGEVRAADEREAALRARVAASERSAEDEARRAEELDARARARAEERERLAAELEALTRAAHEAEARAARAGEALRELQRRYAEARGAAQRANDVVLERLHERTSLRNSVEHLERSLAPLAERAERAARRREEAERLLAEVREGAARGEEAAARGEEELEAAARRRAALENEVRGLDARAAALEEERGAAALERARLASRVETLLDRERELELLGAGARELQGALAAGEGPTLAREIAGLVADHLRTGSQHARALDAALGARAEALVVASHEDALAVLAWLSARERGHARLAVPDGLAARGPAEAARAALEALASDERVLGPLLARVRVAPGFEALAWTLLGDVVLARDADAAVALWRAHPGLRFVTPDGALVEAGGVAGGHRDVVGGAVGRRSQAEELGAEVRRLAAIAARAEEALASLATERDERRRAARALAAEIEAGRAGLAEARSRAAAARERAGDVAESFEEAARECAALAAERERVTHELEEARGRLAEVEARFEEENARLAEAEERRRVLEGERERAAHEEGRLREERGRLAEQAEGAGRRLQDLAAAERELAAELERARRLSGEHRAGATAGRAEAEEVARRRGALLASRGELEEALASARERERAARAGVLEVRRREGGATRELEELLAELSERRLDRQRLEMRRDECLRRAEADFGLVPDALLEGFEPDPELESEEALEALAREVAELRARMDALGPVNVEAVEELEEVAGRLGFLTSQRDDVLGARRSLESTIARIDEESERLFLEAFAEIRGHFQTIFRQLFGGGRADVALVEGAPALEAGIEIHARPPGRETLPIGLLSGGQRTLTALALLFAVFRSRPSPFCVLDEVDAALDDANIGRFLQLLQEFRADTQFVVVTHNKGTMADCDVLYGVTMAVRGVSRVVSVELADVDEIVPEATGNGAGAAGGERPPPAPRSGSGNENGSANGSANGDGRAEESGGNGELHSRAPAERPDDADAPPAGPEEGDGGERVVELVPRGRAARSAAG